jgi:signal transduction histidine kinase
LREYLERWQEQTGIGTKFTFTGDVRVRPVVELQLMRIIQEALANVRKHARATTATVDVARIDGTIRVTVTDDGQGFNPAAKARTEFPRFGLSTMRERADSIGGTLTIDSGPGKGTTVRFELPGA